MGVAHAGGVVRFVIPDEQPEPYEKKRDFCRLDAAGVSLLSFSKEICLEGELYENRCAVDFHCGVCAAASAAVSSSTLKHFPFALNIIAFFIQPLSL